MKNSIIPFAIWEMGAMDEVQSLGSGWGRQAINENSNTNKNKSVCVSRSPKYSIESLGNPFNYE